MEDPKQLIEELIQEVEGLKAEKKKLLLALDTADLQAKEAEGQVVKSLRLLKEETANFRTQIEQLNLIIYQNQKDLLELVGDNSRNTNQAMRSMKKEVAEAVTAVTTLTSGFEQRSKQAFKKISEDHKDAVAEVGQEVRTSLGLVRFFPWLLVGFSALLVGSAVAWGFMAVDMATLKDNVAKITKDPTDIPYLVETATLERMSGIEQSYKDNYPKEFKKLQWVDTPSLQKK